MESIVLILSLFFLSWIYSKFLSNQTEQEICGNDWKEETSARQKKERRKRYVYIGPTLIHDSDFQALYKYYAKIFCAT